MTGSNARLYYLDGLRGWAALSVLVFHSTWEFFGPAFPAVRVYWLSLLNDGDLAVSVFFVLSGIVLSFPFIQSGDVDRVRATFAGRYARLTIPIAGAALISLALVWAGLFYNRPAAAILNGSEWLARLARPGATAQDCLWFILVGVYSDPPSSLTFGPFLWTMRLELIGSALIFTVLLVCQASWRGRWIAYGAGLCALGMLWPELLPFLYGMMIAEAIARRLRGRPPGWPERILGLVLFALAALLSSTVRVGLSIPGDGALAALLVAAVVLSTDLQRLLQTRLSRWLGTISFPLYLIHGAVLCSLSSYLVVVADAHQALGGGTAAAIAALGMALSLGVAHLLAPVEALAVRVAHRVGRALV